jgi:hypothetical protein
MEVLHEKGCSENCRRQSKLKDWDDSIKTLRAQLCSAVALLLTCLMTIRLFLIF